MGYQLLNHGNTSGTNNQSSSLFEAVGSSTKYQELDTFRIIFETVIAVLGVVGNIAVCAVITNNTRKRSSTEYLLRNLAIADLGVLFVIFPLALVKEKMPFHWPFGKFICLYVYPATETFYGVSVWTIVAIAVERYRHLYNPIKRGRQRLVKNAKRLASSIWVGSFLLFAVPLFFWIDYLEQGQNKLCYFNIKNPKVSEAYILLLLLLWYVIPVGIIIWTYVAISKQLHQSNIFLKKMQSNNLSPEMLVAERYPEYSDTQERRLKQNKRVKKILTPVVAVFIITMLPVNVFRVVILYHPAILQSPLYPLLIYFVAFCVVINSSINPLIYCFVSRGFRAGIMAFLKRRPFKGFFILGSVVYNLKERIHLKIKGSRLLSFENDTNPESRKTFKVTASTAVVRKACEFGSQQTVPD